MQPEGFDACCKHGYWTDPTVLDRIIAMFGNPVIAMVIAMAFCYLVNGTKAGRTMGEVGSSMSEALKSIANLLMVIGGGAAFKGILTAGGISTAIASAFSHTSLSPNHLRMVDCRYLACLSWISYGCWFDDCRNRCTIGC